MARLRTFIGVDIGKNIRDRAVALQEEVVSQTPDAAARETLARAFVWAGVVHLHYGRVAQARDDFAKCRKVWEGGAPGNMVLTVWRCIVDVWGFRSWPGRANSTSMPN